MSTEVRQNLADQFLRDLGQTVILTRVAGDLLEDALLGPAANDAVHPGTTTPQAIVFIYRTACPVGTSSMDRQLVALCCGFVTLPAPVSLGCWPSR